MAVTGPVIVGMCMHGPAPWMMPCLGTQAAMACLAVCTPVSGLSGIVGPVPACGISALAMQVQQAAAANVHADVQEGESWPGRWPSGQCVCARLGCQRHHDQVRCGMRRGCCPSAGPAQILWYARINSLTLVADGTQDVPAYSMVVQLAWKSHYTR